MILNIALLIAVGALWGCTNPLIKKGTHDINKVKSNSRVLQFFLELKYLFTNYRYILPMVLNQLGSILYFFTLQSTEISLAVPVANSLTFVFTAITGWLLNEGMPNKKTIVGACFIVAGTSLLCYDKYVQKNEIK